MSTFRTDDWDQLSLWEQMALLPQDEMDAAIIEMVRNGVDLDDPEIRFRPTQLEVMHDTESWILLFNGARGTGKTRVGGAWVNQKAKQYPGCRIALIGRTVADVRDTIVGGESGIIAYALKGFEPHYTPSIRKLEWPNGSTATTYCVTPATEALTRKGWKSHDAISVGDDILTLNTDTMQSEWQPVEALHTFNVDEPLIRTKMKGHHSLCTVSHRWPAIHKSTGAFRWKESILDFNTKDAIIGGVEPSLSVFPEETTYSDEFVELVAWFTTEGHVTRYESKEQRCVDRSEFSRIITERRKYLGWIRSDVEDRIGWNRGRLISTEKGGGGDPKVREEIAYGLGLSTARLDDCFEHTAMRQVVTITQDTGRYSVDIERALEKLYGPQRDSLKDVREPAWRKSTSTPLGRNERCFYFLTHEAYEQIQPLIVGDPFDKIISTEFISALTQSQAELYLTTFINGDGSWRPNGNLGSSSVATQKVGPRLDSLEMAACLLGYSTRRAEAYFILNYEPDRIKPGHKNGPVKSRILDGYTISATKSPTEMTFSPVRNAVQDARVAEDYQGVVWCPQTSNQTWFARHDGTVYYTGNSADSPNQLRGPQQHFAYCDELAAYPQKPDDSGATAWDHVIMSTRLGDHPQILATTTPKRVPTIRNLVAQSQEVGSGVRLLTGSTWDNRANLSREYIDAIYNRYAGTHLERQELHGELIGDAAGALWNASDIVLQTPPTDRELITIVGVDPAVTYGGDSTGIVVCCSTMEPDPFKRQAWVLEDQSMNSPVEQWGRVVVNLQREYSKISETNPRGIPAIIVVEKNQGGDLIKALFNAEGLDQSAPVIDVSAKVSKSQRAEPVVMAYRQKRVFHAEDMPLLVDELTSWEPNVTRYSPDRLDALVWALSVLLIDPRPIARWAPILVSNEVDYASQTLGGVSPAWKRDRGVRTGLGTAPWRTRR